MPKPPPSLDAPRGPRPKREPSDPGRGFWPRCGARLAQWASPRHWFGKASQPETCAPLEAFSGLRDLRESASYKELQGLVDRTQAAPDGGLVHQLVDLALFSEGEPPPAN